MQSYSVIIYNTYIYKQLTSSPTSLDPDVFAELGGHAHQESLPLGSDSFMEVITPATDDLQVHRKRMETESGNVLLLPVMCVVVKYLSHLHDLLVFCGCDKVSKNLLDNVFPFGGLRHYKR